jgi:peptidoglycan/LPS O-acetylase OafA/YrhL
MHRIKELDGLRAFAIGAVFLVHFRPVHHSVFNFMAFGWAGVDLFFVISGFLITGVLLDLRRQTAPFKKFYWRRSLRIVPPYYLALTLILLLAYVRGERIPRRETLEAWTFLSSLQGLSLKLMSSRLFLQSSCHVERTLLDFHHYVDFERGLRVFWSLSVEELFYLFWAPVVLKGSRKFIAFCSVAPVLLCPVIRALNHTSTFMETANFFARFDSLSVGACLALLFVGAKRGVIEMPIIERSAFILAPASALALALLAWRSGVFQNVQVKSALAFAVFGYSLIALFWACIVGVCVRFSGTKFTRFVRLRPLVYLGLISYMMYLIHLPVYVAVGIAFARIGRIPHIEFLQPLFSVTVTVALAALSWRYFESPILRLKYYGFPTAEGRTYFREVAGTRSSSLRIDSPVTGDEHI